MSRFIFQMAIAIQFSSRRVAGEKQLPQRTAPEFILKNLAVQSALAAGKEGELLVTTWNEDFKIRQRLRSS